ncbi:hypothetical protein [Synechococcus sp. CS-1328]|uniref:hypothetical protein n=1 Tax=Synechococcus sp. CS-1328 TaxID=2847976 RepID=UPI00223AF44F|nr:hypothetical protein [Synechococcus sp. CS-1328]MCT0224890.1 hypothetical protein [Synechococcus sp. CS-1328]
MAINQLLVSHQLVSSSQHFVLPRVEQIRTDGHSILVSYSYVHHHGLRWKNLCSDSRASMLALAAADFNTLNSNPQRLSAVSEKEFSFTLTPQKLQRIFPEESESFHRATVDEARHLYQALLERARRHRAFSFLGLAHNDLVPSNIGIPVAIADENQTSEMSSHREAPCREESRRMLFLDVDNATIAPLGSDLRFVLLAMSAHQDSIMNLRRIAKVYHSQACLASPGLGLQAVVDSAILGYADAWLNIHRRARSHLDRVRLERCLRVCRAALNEE